jgi:hypothetical protein
MRRTWSTTSPPHAQTIKTPRIRVVRKFQARYGQDGVTGDAIDAAYNSVRLWAQAVAEAESEQPELVRKFLGRQSLNAPEGIISIDAETHHTWRPSFIGKIRSDKQLDIVWTSGTPIRPDPFPPSRSRAEWQAFLDNLYQRRGGNWINTPHYSGSFVLVLRGSARSSIVVGRQGVNPGGIDHLLRRVRWCDSSPAPRGATPNDQMINPRVCR